MARRTASAVLVALSIACVLAVSLSTRPAHADNRPTSGDMSLMSGRTLGGGYTALAAGIGWPGIWAGVYLAPSSSFNFSIRGSVLYGSPVMGFSGGVGGEISVPFRLHVFGRGQLDISVAITPSFAAGQGSLAGQEGAFSDDFGYVGRGDGGVLAGAQLSRSVTITLGAMGSFGWLNVSKATPDNDFFFGSAYAIAGIELLTSRDTMLFAEAHGGYGFTSNKIYASNAIGRIWVGIAYLL